MKSTLRLKFIMLYIIFGFLSIFTVSLLSNQLLLNKLEQDSSQNMYRIANQTATSYSIPRIPFTSASLTIGTLP